MASPDSLIPAVNKISNWKLRNTDQTLIFPEFWSFARVLLRSSSPDSVMTNLQPKRINRIWISSSFNVDQGYGHGFVQRLTYKEIHSIKVLMHKLWIKISWWLLNENAWFKCQTTPRSTHYLSHVLILRIKGFENSPSWSAVGESACIWPWFLKTDEECWLWRWLMMKIQLTGAWIRGKLQLPLMSDTLHSENLATILLQCLKQSFRFTCTPRIHKEIATILMTYWWNDEESEYQKCENWENLVRFWIGSENVIILAILLELSFYTCP